MMITNAHAPTISKGKLAIVSHISFFRIYNYWFACDVIAAMLVSNEQKISH
jgi:hypothetical protein